MTASRFARNATATLTVTACVALASCASTASSKSYNPNRLSAADISQVSEICETEMSFPPGEPRSDNLWPGDPDPEISTNRYRGCIATLSNALTRAAVVRASRQAEQDCASQGLAAGSSDLARCVLTVTSGLPSVSQQAQLAALDPTPLLAAAGPKYSAAIPSSVHKEQLACADIGIDPNDAGFATCVQGLKNVSLALSMQIFYTND